MSRLALLFELAVELVRRHEAPAGDGRVRILPVLVDSLPDALPIIDALCQMTNGSLLDATGRPETNGRLEATRRDATTILPPPLDDARRALVEQAVGGGFSLGRELQVLVDNAGVNVALVPASDDPSPAERTLLALSRALLCRDLDERELVAVVYSESELDGGSAAAAWDLAVELLGGYRNQTLRTLIVLVEGSIDIGRHASSEQGFAFALAGERLHRQNGHKHLLSEVEIFAMQTRPIVLFLGAGFSFSSGMPLGDPLRDQAIRQLLPHTRSLPNSQLAQEFYSHASQHWPNEIADLSVAANLTLEQVVRVERRMNNGAVPTLELLRQHHDVAVTTPGPAVRDLIALVHRGRGRLVLATVNFDRLLETGAPPEELEVFATDAEFAGAPEYLKRYLAGQESAVPLLKFHGTITDFDSCVVDSQKTGLGLGDAKIEALRTLQGEDDERPRLVIYVGMSMRDRDLLAELGTATFARRFDERWVLPTAVESVEQFCRARAEVWDGRDRKTLQGRLITAPADAFFRALLEAWPKAGAG